MGCFNKFFLFVLNFFVFAIGVAVIGLASAVIHKSGVFNDLFTDGTSILSLPIWTLVVGLFIALIGFFGCCGALRENKCMLYSYAIIVLVLLIAELALGILILVKPEEVKDQIKTGLKKTFEKYGEEGRESLTNSIDLLQSQIKCCGVTNYTDWFDIPAGSTNVTKGCCIVQTDDCFINIKDMDQPEIEEKIYTTGCYYAFVSEVKGEAIALAVTAIILAIIQFACITIACGLAKNSRRSEYA